MYIVHLTLRTSCHGIPYFFCIFTQVLTFYWLFWKIWPSWIRNKSNFWKEKKIGEVMTERKTWILRIQYMATWHDGTFDVNMTPSEVVRTRHHIRRFLRRFLVLKIKPNTGQTLGTTDKREVLFDYWDFEDFLLLYREAIMWDESNPFCSYTLEKHEITVTHSPQS